MPNALTSEFLKKQIEIKSYNEKRIKEEFEITQKLYNALFEAMNINIITNKELQDLNWLSSRLLDLQTHYGKQI